MDNFRFFTPTEVVFGKGVENHTLTNATLFHVIEYCVMFALVISFTFMLRRLFLGRGENRPFISVT